MPATPRTLHFSEKDLKGAPERSGNGTWSEIEVPGDYELTLLRVEDYDKRNEGKSYGWVFIYGIETSTGWCEFREWLSFSDGARWKIQDTIKAFIGSDGERDEGIDPNSLVGMKVAGRVDFPRGEDGEPSSNYRRIFDIFPIPEDEPLMEATDEEVPFDEELEII